MIVECADFFESFGLGPVEGVSYFTADFLFITIIRTSIEPMGVKNCRGFKVHEVYISNNTLQTANYIVDILIQYCQHIPHYVQLT